MFSIDDFMPITIKVKTDFKHTEGLPSYATAGSAGVDLRSNARVEIRPFSTELVPTGITINWIPLGYELQVRPRSGISLKTALRVANSPGTIDSDYRGEIKIIMSNISAEDIIIPLGERIAQLVPQKVPRLNFSITNEEIKTERGDGGFGSTNDK